MEPRTGCGASVQWTAEIAYAVGLVATDGCLSPDRPSINFTSCDRDLIEVFLQCVDRPGKRISSYRGRRRDVYSVRFVDRELYSFFVSAGLTPRKSLTLGAISVPASFLAPLVRGLLDGDGSLDCYVHRPIRKTYSQYRYQRLGARFRSASRVHIAWLRDVLKQHLGVDGALFIAPKHPPQHDMYILQFGKHASIRLLSWLHRDSASRRLERKFQVWRAFIERERRGEVIYRRASTHFRALSALERA